MSEILNIEKLAEEYDNCSPQEIVELAVGKFKNIAISFSGAEDVVLVDMAKKPVRTSGFLRLIRGACILRPTSSSKRSGTLTILISRYSLPTATLRKSS